MNDLINRLLLVLVLLGINAFFVTAEFAIVASRRSRIRQLAESGNLAAKDVQYFHRHLDQLLSTTQIGITVACLGLGWLGKTTLSHTLEPLLQSFSPQHAAPLVHWIALPFAFLAIAYLQIVLGELCPKSLAFTYAEQLACHLAPTLKFLNRLIFPFSRFVNHSTHTLLRFSGIEISRNRWSHHITPEELDFIITTEGDALGLESMERALFKNLLTLGKMTAADIMVPRTQMAVINADATYGELLTLITQTGHTRFPVKGQSLDDIVGLIDFADLALPLQQQQLQPTTLLKPWFRPCRFLPESLSLPELLQKMQRTQTQSVVIVDEFGGTAGLVCWEDVVTELLDPTQVEEEHETSLILQTVDAQTWVVDAQITLGELNDILGFRVPNPDNYQTLGGFLLYAWQRIPKPGDSLAYDNYLFTVAAAEGPKLQRIRIERQVSSPKPLSSVPVGAKMP